MNKRPFLIWGALALAVIVVAAIAWRMLGSPALDATHPTRGPAVQAVYATGTVEPSVMTPIAPRIGARIVDLETDEGADVTKGQVLARLESQDVQNNIAQLVAQENFARQDYERDARLVKGQIIAQATYDKAKAAWQAAHAATEAARAQAGYMLLTSPGNCSIIQRDGEVGQFIPVNQPVFWLSCHAPLRISAQVDEEDVSLVHLGQKVLIRADAFPGKIFNGTVQEITPKGDPVARSYRVRIAIPQDSSFRIGMTAETNIVVHQSNDALLVPSSALIDGNKVWVIENGALDERAVQVGAKGAEEVEIRGGLSQSDVVVKSPDATLKQGARVRARMQ